MNVISLAYATFLVQSWNVVSVNAIINYNGISFLAL